jgi:putative ABC transport system permease protein
MPIERRSLWRRSVGRTHNWRRYIRFWGPNVDADIDDELRFHLEARIAEYERLGYSPDDAARLTRERVGELTEVRTRLRRHDKQKLTIYRSREHMRFILQDVQYGLRKLRQAPGFSLAVIAVLALGIGANTAIYSVVDAAMLRPLPFPHAEQLVRLGNMDVAWNMGGPPHPQDIAHVQDAARLPVFSHVAAYAVGGLNMDAGRAPKRSVVAYVSLDFFRTVGLAPRLGRTFTQDEAVSNGRRAVIVSDRVWRQQFGADPAALGKMLRLNARQYEIVGVMPANFSYPSDPDVWLPLPLTISDMGIFEAFKNYIPTVFIARAKPGVSVQQAGQALAGLERQFPSWKRFEDTSAASLVQPLQKTLVAPGGSSDVRTALLVLMGAAGLVLLIACANVANLLLARGASRTRELAIRSVLGATRVRVLRQLAIESLLLALGGAVCGIVLAWLAVGALTSLLPASLVAIARPTLDLRVLGFTMVVAILVGLIVGVWPGLTATRESAGELIKAGGAHGATKRRGGWVRGGLVVVEMSLALVLLVGAGLMIESFRVLVTAKTGIRPDHVVTAQITLPSARYRGTVPVSTFYRSLLADIRRTPGVDAAAMVNVLPLANQGGIGLYVRAADAPEDESHKVVGQYLMVTPGYFNAIGMPLLRGEDFADATDSLSKPVIINRVMAERLWPGRDPLGRQIMFGKDPLRVVGVVADARTYTLSDSAGSQMYLPLLANGVNDANIVVRGTAPPGVLESRIAEAVRAIDPGQAVYNVRTMDEVISKSVAPRRTNTLLLSIFGALALALSGIGVYSVLAYSVAQRTREIGVRVALGAERGAVLNLVLRQGVLFAIVGAAIGLIAAVALSRLIASLLYQVSPHDPRIFVLAPLTLMVIALAATLIPALRATRVDPMEALRAE